ncbi:MAG TPA: AMP-binding protein [Bryobacteraceae bacterium]|nr:AMP-binding protein [Bryobacteraceae bacterium]
MASPWIWEPTPEFIEKTNVYRFMRRVGLRTHQEFIAWSQRDVGRFWDEMVREMGVDWFAPYSHVLDTSRGVEWARWFTGGKLNIAANCLDRHAAVAARDRTAIVWEGENGATRSLTFAALRRETDRLANGMRALGLVAGDRVALCMPMVPEVVIIVYACFKLGLIAVPVFSGFGYEAIAVRLADSGARLLFTADYLERRGRRIALKEKTDEALEQNSTVEHVVVWRYQGGEVPWTAGRDIWWDDLVAAPDAECAAASLDSETPALLLYTSGTTGRPKGAVHTHAGALVQTGKEIYLTFDHQPDDCFWWVSDIGWMMGPWEIIGNHLFGGTVLLYDGAPDFPTADRFWQTIERRRVTAFGISPTAIRLLMRKGGAGPDGYGLGSLRLLGSTGEPWDESSYRWFFERVGGGRLPIMNISGGTEIIGCFLAPLPIQPLKACSLGGPSPGMATDVFDAGGRPVRGQLGYLVCTQPAPSMTRGVWNDPQRYLEAYWSRWPGVWYHGDWAAVDADGCWFLHGRADETFNVAGRKVGPAEVEACLIEHAAVSEAAVIGVPDELTGESVVAFVVLKPGARLTNVSQELSAHLARRMGPTFRPRAVLAVGELPKTQSGKVVRRLIRHAYLGEALGDTSTVENPGALAQCAARVSEKA